MLLANIRKEILIMKEEKKENGNMNGSKKYIRYSEGMEMYGLGYKSFRRLACESGSLYKFGKTMLIRVDLLDAYMERFKVMQEGKTTEDPEELLPESDTRETQLNNEKE